ncbi:PIG-L family deacetylase [Kitasatospora sp. NRRL B-11411]|uniref:PIG-L family deacetylase n=1 Tax=Kitasatospora sp. NRRL B-11411 TaxID=1463822 RepID=UPI0006909BBD|nr:PIG-L family deacetylase [Kitasatospora sp. NRRL B-11411]
MFQASPRGSGDDQRPTAPDTGALLAGARLLVGDRDAAAATATAEALRRYGAARVRTAASPHEFRAAEHADLGWDLAVCDSAFAGDGLTEFLEEWHAQHPAAPVIVTEDRPDAARAVAALRGRAADLVPRHDPDALAASAAHALARPPHAVRPPAAERVGMLVVGAHPDDVEIAAGGTIHRRAGDGWDITVLTLSPGANGGDPARRRREAHRAAESMGARLVMEDLPDGSISDDSATVRVIERTVAEAAPDVVLVHSDSDTHQDHRAVHRATRVACRQVPRVFCYQSPSATVAYRPNRFVALREEDVDAKLSAIRAHGSQASSRWYLEEDLLRSTARYWGRFSRSRYAEPLEVLRDAAPFRTH